MQVSGYHHYVVIQSRQTSILCYVMLCYVNLILCRIAPSACNGRFSRRSSNKKKKQKNKTVQTSIRYCRRTMTLYRTIKKLIMIMSHTIHCNTIKSHNTVHARTTLLKAAELVSSFSSDGSYRSSNNSTNMIPRGSLRLVFTVNLLLIGRILQTICHLHWYVVHTHKYTTNYINILH